MTTLDELKKEALDDLRVFNWEYFFGANSKAQQAAEKNLTDAIDRAYQVGKAESVTHAVNKTYMDTRSDVAKAYRQGLKKAAEIAREKERKYYDMASKDVLDDALWSASKVTAKIIAAAIEAEAKEEHD